MKTVVYQQELLREAEVAVSDDDFITLKERKPGWEEVQQRIVDTAVVLCANEALQFQSAVCFGPDDEELFDIT